MQSTMQELAEVGPVHSEKIRQSVWYVWCRGNRNRCDTRVVDVSGMSEAESSKVTQMVLKADYQRELTSGYCSALKVD